MSSSWFALHAHVDAAIRRHSFLAKFNLLTSRDEALAEFADPVALLDRLHRPDGDPDGKDAILRSLVLAAQSDAAADAATALLHLALWPGLDHARHRLRRLFGGALDELTAEIAAEFARQVRTCRLDRVNRVAATLVMNVERDVRRRRMKELRRRAQSSELDGDAVAAETAPSVLTLLADAHDDDGLRRLEARIARLIGEDAALVVDIAVRHTPQREAAAARGLSHDAGRKRYQRAVSKLRAALAA